MTWKGNPSWRRKVQDRKEWRAVVTESSPRAVAPWMYVYMLGLILSKSTPNNAPDIGLYHYYTIFARIGETQLVIGFVSWRIDLINLK